MKQGEKATFGRPAAEIFRFLCLFIPTSRKDTLLTFEAVFAVKRQIKYGLQNNKRLPGQFRKSDSRPTIYLTFTYLLGNLYTRSCGISHETDTRSKYHHLSILHGITRLYSIIVKKCTQGFFLSYLLCFHGVFFVIILSRIQAYANSGIDKVLKPRVPFSLEVS